MNPLRVRTVTLLLCLGCSLAGCRAAPEGPTPEEWSAIAACLPDGVELSTEFCEEREGCAPAERMTVRRKLTLLGARARGGKLYDASGKEIYFHRVPRSGPAVGPEWQRKQAEHLEALRRK
jgi:hypothetical protein